MTGSSIISNFIIENKANEQPTSEVFIAYSGYISGFTTSKLFLIKLLDFSL